MLASLRITNLALVESLFWELRPGFNAITGETGAGKSIVIGALKLLLGERADKGLIRHGKDSCTVEGVFELEDVASINALLEESGLEPCEDGQLIIRRIITPTSSRQFLNGGACNLQILRRLGEKLIDLHGPHDHQSLFSTEQQTLLLDRFAGAEELRRTYESQRAQLLDLRAQLQELEGAGAALERELDLLRHQVREIEAANIQPGEEEELVARHRVACSAQRLGELSASLATLLLEDQNSILEQLGEAERLLRELAELDPSAEEFLNAHTAATEMISENATRLSSYASRLESDPAQLREMEERLDTLQTLKRKYGPTLEDVLAYAEEASAKLSRLESRDENAAALRAQIQEAEDQCRETARKLTAARKRAAKTLAANVRKELEGLGFRQPVFETSLAPCPEFSPHGAEEAEFLIAPNPGEPAAPLRSIASSGEISRIMLALKSVLARQDSVPLLVFDEIDANVGGDIAGRIGEKMRALGERHQVLCITHLPPVAARASAHFLVEKHTDSGRTSTTLQELGNAEREREIARMLGGRAQSALEHARALLSA